MSDGRATRRSPVSLSMISHDPKGIADDRRDGIGFKRLEVIACLRIDRPPERHHPRTGERGGKVASGGRQLLERDLIARRTSEQFREDGVRPFDDAFPRAKTAVQDLEAVRETVLHRGVHANVGASEPVDRLLGVAHEHETVGLQVEATLRERHRVAGVDDVCVARERERHRNLGLERVGILELVDQQMAVLLPTPHTCGRITADHVAGEDQHVVEREQSGLSTLLRRFDRRRRNKAEKRQERLVRDASENGPCAIDPTASVIDVRPVLRRSDPLTTKKRRHQRVAERETVVGFNGVQQIDPMRDLVGDLGCELVVDPRAQHHLRLGEHTGERRDHTADRDRRDGRLRCAPVEPRPAAVPFTVQLGCDVAPASQVDAEPDRAVQRLAEQAVGGEQPIADRDPSLIESFGLRKLVDDLDPPGQTDHLMVRHDETLRERVERDDRRQMEVTERLARTLLRDLACGESALRVVGHAVDPVAARCFHERDPDPVAKLRGGLLGERDRGNLIDGAVPRQDQANDPTDETCGLPGARAGVHETHDATSDPSAVSAASAASAAVSVRWVAAALSRPIVMRSTGQHDFTSQNRQNLSFPGSVTVS